MKDYVERMTWWYEVNDGHVTNCGPSDLRGRSMAKTALEDDGWWARGTIGLD